MNHLELNESIAPVIHVGLVLKHDLGNTMEPGLGICGKLTWVAPETYKIDVLDSYGNRSCLCPKAWKNISKYGLDYHIEPFKSLIAQIFWTWSAQMIYILKYIIFKALRKPGMYVIQKRLHKLQCPASLWLSLFKLLIYNSEKISPLLYLKEPTNNPMSGYLERASNPQNTGIVVPWSRFCLCLKTQKDISKREAYVDMARQISKLQNLLDWRSASMTTFTHIFHISKMPEVLPMCSVQKVKDHYYVCFFWLFPSKHQCLQCASNPNNVLEWSFCCFCLRLRGAYLISEIWGEH